MWYELYLAYDAGHFTLMDSLLLAFPHLRALFDDDDQVLRDVKRRRVSGRAEEEAPRREQQYQENEKRAALERTVRRAYDDRLFNLFDRLLLAFPHLHALFEDNELKAAETELRKKAKDRRAGPVSVSLRGLPQAELCSHLLEL